MSEIAQEQINIAKIREILGASDGARFKTWLGICSRCGLCAQSCLFFLANKRDPRLSPAYKIKSTLGELYRGKGKVDRGFLRKCGEVAWGECTVCKRCSLYCPFGIDISAMIAVVRSICNSQGIVPEGLTKVMDNYRDTGNLVGMSAEDFADTCSWMAREFSSEIAGLEIPIDKPGARVMYTVSGREPMYYPQEIAVAAKIFAVAGEDWTLPGQGWDCTNLAMFAGDQALASRLVRQTYDSAIKLGVEQIAVTECGDAFRAMAFEGPYLAGYRDGKPPVPVVSSVRLFYEYLREERIKIDPGKMIDEPVTYQDPCNISRNGGLWREGRFVLSCIARDFRDMSPNREYNHCCGGGGGFIPMGAEFKKRRIAAGRIKAEQIKATGAGIVIAPCHNCLDQIRNLNHEYNLGIRALLLKDIIAQTMIVPDKFKPAHTGNTGDE